VFKVVRPDPGVRIHDTLTRLEYKEDNCEFLNCKVRLSASGDQQISGVSFQGSDLCAPFPNSIEAWLFGDWYCRVFSSPAAPDMQLIGLQSI
jgi:hypothetical protein